MNHTKGEWKLRKGPKDSDKWWDIPRPDSTSCIATIWSTPDDEETIANARLISAAPDLLVVSHNLAHTMGIDYAIKKLSVMDDNLAVGAATILKGIQRQAKKAEAKAKQEGVISVKR
ncbi:hypothetical protein LCGC14_1881580, partial [marine sediment metagenome]